MCGRPTIDLSLSVFDYASVGRTKQLLIFFVFLVSLFSSEVFFRAVHLFFQWSSS